MADSNQIRIIRPGTKVLIGSEIESTAIPATVKSVQIFGGSTEPLLVVYHCAWWAGRDYKTADFGADEIFRSIREPHETATIGFH